MTFSSCLIDQSSPIILDSSVVINLLATGCAKKILEALPGHTCVTENVVGEIEGGSGSGHSESIGLLQLIRLGNIEVVDLDDQALDVFVEIVSGATEDSLGDGEAATIAFAHCSGSIAAIDEKKATRIVSNRFGSLRVATTVDIFAYPDVTNALGPKQLSSALLNALQLARMQVWAPQFNWVVDRIGAHNVPLCPSLRRLVRKMPARATG